MAIEIPGYQVPGKDYRPRVGQKTGPLYKGIEQPTDALKHLDYSQGGPGAIPEDRLGLDLQARGMAHANAYRQEEYARTGLLSGPLPSPMWEGFQQALADKGVKKVVGGQSAPGSHQLTGFSAQPDFFTGPAEVSAMGRPNAGFQGTTFAPGQTSAITGSNYDQEQNFINNVLHGLRRAR